MCIVAPVRERADLEFSQRYCTYNVPWGERAMFTAVLREAPYRAGERIRGTLSLHNLSNQPAQSLSVCLVSTETAYSGSKQIVKNTSRTVVETEMSHTIPPNSAKELPFTLAIPPDVPRTASGLFFDFSWSVELRLKYGLLDMLTAARNVNIY